MNWYTVDSSTAAFSVLATTTAKKHLNLPLEPTDDDVEIDAMVCAAENFVAARAGGRYGIQRTIDVVMSRFPYGDDPFCIPIGPLQSITSITYFDANNSSTTLASSDITLHKPRQRMPYIRPIVDTTWPGTQHRDDAVTVKAVVGHSTGSTDAGTERAKVPAAFTHACKLALADLYENRGDVDAMSNRTVDRIDALVATEGNAIYA